MATICGLNCDECEGKILFDCKGCLESDGHPYYGECPIVSCCHGKGFQTCGGCAGQDLCLLRQNAQANRDKQLMYHKRKAALAQEKNAQMRQKSPVLGKWLRVLFWITFPALLASLLTNTQLTGGTLVVRTVGYILLLACAAINIIAYFKMSPFNTHFKKAAVVAIVVLTLSFISILMDYGMSPHPAILVIVSLVQLILGLYSAYCLFNGCADVLEFVDDALSANWLKLWKWYAGLCAGIFAGLLLLLMATRSMSGGGIALGAIVLVVVTVGLIVVTIFELIYLYRSANVFRDWEAAENADT